MVCARTAESLQITDKKETVLKQMENFEYLGSVTHTQGGNEEDITARIAAAWKKWKELSGVLRDRRKSIQNNGKARIDLWFRGTDIKKSRRRALGENRNENVAIDPWSYLE